MTHARNKFEIEVFRIGWFGRIVSVLLSAVLFLAVFVFGALALAIVTAAVVVVAVKLWWLRCRAGAAGGAVNQTGRTLDVDFEVIASDDENVEILRQRK